MARGENRALFVFRPVRASPRRLNFRTTVLNAGADF